MEGEKGICLYGVIWAESLAAPRPGEMGIGGADLRLVDHGDLAAVVSTAGADLTADRPSARQLRRDLAAHAEALNRMSGRGDILPVRFGVVFPDEATLVAELLVGCHDELVGELRRLGGAIAVSLNVAYDEQSVLAEVVRERPQLKRRATALAERIDLGERIALAVREKKEREAARLLDRLSPFAREVAVHDTGLDMQLLRASFLVDRGRIGEFDAAVDRIQKEAGSRLKLACVGPLPPYSFVRTRLTAGDAVEA